VPCDWSLVPASERFMADTPQPGRRPARFRWHAFFEAATEPIFLLSPQRRLLFANPAWETWAGMPLRAVRGRACRRRSAEAELDQEEQLLALLAPPPAALQGEVCSVRRRLAQPANTGWCEIGFFPLRQANEVHCILGRIRAAALADAVAFTLPERLMALRDRLAGRYRLEDLGGASPQFERVREQARLAAEMARPVLLLGEPGVGKTWLARVLHAAGPAKHAYFARLDCARLPAAAVSDVLFEPRSARLSLGTIYVREPASLPRDVQDRLARHLAAEPAAGPRLILGMCGDPAEAVRGGRLLEELYCRVSTLTIELPPLRQRLDELPHLVDVFLQRAADANERPRRTLSAEAMQVLEAHAWPGNLRELYAVLRDAGRRGRGEHIERADLPFYLRHGPQPAERRLPLDALLEQTERRLIELALRLARGNKSRAAELLEIWRPRLLRRLEHFGLLEAGGAEAD
jgi:transcriptional regulator with PAS, ATPase and Fis domain